MYDNSEPISVHRFPWRSLLGVAVMVAGAAAAVWTAQKLPDVLYGWVWRSW